MDTVTVESNQMHSIEQYPMSDLERP